MADSIWPLPTRDVFAQICGEIACASILTGAVVAVPMSLRVLDHAALMSTLPSLAGVCAALATAVVFLIRTSSAGLHKVLPDRFKRSMLLFACSVWIVLSVVILAGLGSVLSAVTHHRGLGGTTFAFVGVGVVSICAVLAVRFAQLVRKVSQRITIARVAFGVAIAVVGCVLWTAVKKGSAVGAGEDVRAVGDAAFLALLCIGASIIRLPSSHKRIWVPGAALLLVGIVSYGVSTLDRLAAVPEVRERVLLLSPVLDLIAKPDTQPKRIFKPQHP